MDEERKEASMREREGGRAGGIREGRRGKGKDEGREDRMVRGEKAGRQGDLNLLAPYKRMARRRTKE